MSEQPPDRDPADDVDELYRRASTSDNSRPTEAVRKAVLAHAERVAAAAAAGARTGGAPAGETVRRRANPTRWWPAVFGTLAAAALAGLMILPRMLSTPTPEVAQDALKPPQRDAVPAPPPTAPREEKRAPSVETAKPRARIAVSPPADIAAAKAEQAPAVAKAEQPRAADHPGAAEGVDAPTRAQESARAPPHASEPAQGIAAGAAPELGVAADAAPAAEARSAAPRDLAMRRSSAGGATASGEAALRRAAESGDVPELQRLLDGPFDVDSRDGRGRTALMLATLRGRIDAVGMLLDHGADPNAADSQGLTPLQVATAGNETAIIAALRRKGAR
jgi:hypothetical protein